MEWTSLDHLEIRKRSNSQGDECSIPGLKGKGGKRLEERGGNILPLGPVNEKEKER